MFQDPASNCLIERASFQFSCIHYVLDSRDFFGEVSFRMSVLGCARQGNRVDTSSTDEVRVCFLEQDMSPTDCLPFSKL
jgi:hypothetical protein